MFTYYYYFVKKKKKKKDRGATKLKWLPYRGMIILAHALWELMTEGA
jgi:hypothetical protein